MKELFKVVGRDALISDDELYRWWLSRTIAATDPLVKLVGRLVFIMLNPSTADAKIDDRTIRRCMGFAYSFGCAEIIVVNLFGLRSKDPKALYKAGDPVGPDNDYWIKWYTNEAKSVIAGWGADGGHMGRDRAVLEMLRERKVAVHHLGLNGDGSPKHPLYLPGNTQRTVLC